MEIRFERIEASYDGRPVLKGVTTTIPSGATVSVVGPSGCGKSTFLRLINGLVKPTQGVVFLNGQCLDYSRILSIRRGMGYVMQEAGLFPHVTIEDNLSLLPKLQGWDSKRIAERLKELLALVNLRDPGILARYPRSLSGGQRQRVAIARALMLDPPVLLMDEPFSALDPVIRRELQEEFLRLKPILHRTIVLVTHDFAEAYRLGDRILLLNEGVIEQETSPQEFLRRPATRLAEAFLRSAQGIPQG